MTANRIRAIYRARGGAGAGQDHADEMMALIAEEAVSEPKQPSLLQRILDWICK